MNIYKYSHEFRFWIHIPYFLYSSKTSRVGRKSVLSYYLRIIKKWYFPLITHSQIISYIYCDVPFSPLSIYFLYIDRYILPRVDDAFLNLSHGSKVQNTVFFLAVWTDMKIGSFLLHLN